MANLNELQALNWAKVASAVAQKSASRELEEDLVQSALLAILEDESEDLVDKAWDVRQGIRNPLRRIARNRAYEDVDDHEDGTDPWLTGDDTISESWLQMLDEEDALSRRIREAYEDEDLASDAVAASVSNGGYWGIEDRARMADEGEVDPRWAPPIYMQPEYRLDWGEVDIALDRFKPGWVEVGDNPIFWADLVRHGDEKMVCKWLRGLGREAMRFAHMQKGLSPVEAAVFANGVARMVADEAPKGKEGLYYSVVRTGAGDLMASCEKGRTVSLRAVNWTHADGAGIIPGDTELPHECPGVCSNYGIEDHSVWMWLFPDGPGGETYELPKGDDSDILALAEAVRDRTLPEDVSVSEIGDEWTYTGWQLWDTGEARQAHVMACLMSLASWSECALAGRKAFWARQDHNRLLARNYASLHAVELTRDKDRGYKVTPATDKDPVHTPSEPLHEDEEYWSFIMGTAH